MRRASTCLALLGLIALAAPALATADSIPAPAVTKFTAKSVPVPGVPGTGNFYGKGAAEETEYEFSGTGYGGTPANPAGGIPPLSGVNFYLPKGTKLDTKDFKTVCTEAILKNTGPSACPKKSVASQIGSALGEVTFGTTRVPEEATLQGFFGPGGGLLFFTHGASPVNLEIVSTGNFVKLSGKYAYEFKALVPAVASVPGAPLASVKNIKVKVGAAFKKRGKVISYGTVPKKGECPKGGFPIKTELIFGGRFGGEREFGIDEKVVPAEYKSPCPKH
jgi:hypothetical protein